MTAAQRSDTSIQKARVLGRSGRVSEALVVLEAAREADPANTDVLVALAAIAQRLGMQEAARRCLDEAVAVSPGHIEAAIARATLLSDLGATSDAVAFLRERTLDAPDSAELWTALASILRAEGRLDEAETFYGEALRLRPASLSARTGLADIQFDKGETAAAIAAYDTLVKSASKNAQLRLNRGLARLQTGDTAAGWRDYEWRLKIDGKEIARDYGPGPAPRRWDGSPLRGKALAVLGEQGLGDQIFFAACLESVAARANSRYVGVECDPRLVPLFARSFTGFAVHGFRPQTEEGRIRADTKWARALGAPPAVAEIASLPHILDKSGARLSPVPLVPDTDERARWSAWLDTLGPGLKVGVCWRSGKTGGLRGAQYAPLSAWADFIAATGAVFVCVQYDLEPSELDALSAAAARPLHLPPGLDQRDEIDRLAALMSALDAVVSAPTAVAALSAAVETPTIKVTAAGSWTGLGHDAEPMRPAARIVRPRILGDWHGALQLARQALIALPHAP